MEIDISMSIPEELLEQFERGNVLLFVGERIVRMADGQSLVDHLTAQLATRLPEGDEGTLSFVQAAQVYEDRSGRQALVQFLRDQDAVVGDEPQRAHRLIAGLHGCEVLVTTCRDRRLERAFDQAGRPLDVVIGNLDVVFEDEHKARLYKLHGSLEQVESLVVTEDDHEAFFRGHANLSIVLQAYLARKTILFVGYDLNDPLFQRLYCEVTAPLDNYARRAYAFGEPLPALVSRWCQRHNIQVVEADATAFLASLAAQLTTRARTAPTAPPPAAEAAAAPLPAEPYKLLDYYETQDAALFFGRQDETRRLAALIHAHRLVLFYGASGVGKTSLLLAGVIPVLERTDPPYGTIYVRALEDPAAAIRRAARLKLSDVALPEESQLVDLLATAARVCDRPLVIFLDKFEEFFIRLSPEFRAAFIGELGAVYDAHDVPAKVVLCLREDWLAAVNEVRARIPQVFNVDLRLLPLTAAQARQAIVRPLQTLGMQYEPALVERLLQDLAGGGGEVLPPQLQLVCGALYERLPAGESSIPLSVYEQLGGAQAVLGRYLDSALGRLAADEQAVAQGALAELVTSERTKAVKTTSELALALAAEPTHLQTVLEKLSHARLLRVLDRTGESAYELAHEYLITEIALGPDAVARKEAEELLRQGLDNWSRFQALLSAETFAMIDAQRERLRLDALARELLLRCALRYGRSVGYWLEQVPDEEVALTLAEGSLLTPSGEAVRRGLGAETRELSPARRHALVGRLAAAWSNDRGVQRALASDALWALRARLPRFLYLRLAASRSPRLLRRAALPLAAALVVALVFATVLWGPHLLTPRPQIEWVEVPAGEFVMGSDPSLDPNVRGDEQPQHRAYLDAYRIARYEVTNAQYAQCLQATVCSEQPTAFEQYSDPAYADHPVVSVSWDDAQTFCEWVGGRLPTEAEWEKAARGTDGRTYPWGSDPPTCERAQYWGCEPAGTRSGGSASPAGDSPYGAADMAGNVWEWVSDWYDQYPAGRQENPAGPVRGTNRVLRGGGWNGGRPYLRTTYRGYGSPDSRDSAIGFRCAGAP